MQRQATANHSWGTLTETEGSLWHLGKICLSTSQSPKPF